MTNFLPSFVTPGMRVLSGAQVGDVLASAISQSPHLNRATGEGVPA